MTFALWRRDGEQGHPGVMRAVHPPIHREPRLLPATAAGRWALGLFAVAVVSFAFMTVAVATGQSGGETFSASWWLAVPALLAGSGAVASGVIGAYAILRHHEHAALVYLSTAMGLLVIAFVLGETFASH